jgi:hypothetical protein
MFLKNPHFSSLVSKKVGFLKKFSRKCTFRPPKMCVITVRVGQLDVLVSTSFPEVLGIKSHFFDHFYAFLGTFWSYFLKILHKSTHFDSFWAQKFQKVGFQFIWSMSMTLYEWNPA